MTYSHIKERAEFWALVRDHGVESVEWTITGVEWTQADDVLPKFDSSKSTYRFRLKPRQTVIPEAIVPEEVEGGAYTIMLRTCDSPNKPGDVTCLNYATAEDRDKVLAAMLRREVR